MCRNIRVLHNFDPPTTDDEVREAAVQFVRKVSGSTHPSRANAEALDRELEAIKGRERHEKRTEREVHTRTALI